MKKTLAIILSLVMLIGIMPMGMITASAAPSTTTIDGETFYQISTVDDLLWYGENGSSFSAILMNDLQIGTAEEPYVDWSAVSVGKTFDGNGHTIDMHITYSEVDGAAVSKGVSLLVATSEGKTVKNLILTGSITCNSTYRVGAVSHSGFGSVFENIISYVDITNQSSAPTGGIVGMLGNDGEGSTMTNCAVYADISGTGYVGGLVGQGWSGWQYWELNDCAFFGTVTSDNRAGALMGYSSTAKGASKCHIRNCYYPEGMVAVDGFNTPIGTNDSHAKTAEDFASGAVCELVGFHGNEIVIENEVEVSCTTDGSYDTVVRCAVCGLVASRETIITTPANGHNTNGTVAHKDANCTEDGVVGGTYCDACDLGKAEAEEVISALGHGETEIVGAVQATFENDGYTGDTYCTVCDKKIADGNVIPKLEVPTTPDEPDTPDEPSDSCAECGRVHKNFIDEFICVIISFFNLIKSLF